MSTSPLIDYIRRMGPSLLIQHMRAMAKLAASTKKKGSK